MGETHILLVQLGKKFIYYLNCHEVGFLLKLRDHIEHLYQPVNHLLSISGRHLMVL